ARLADDLDVLARLEHAAQTHARRLLIVDQESAESSVHGGALAILRLAAGARPAPGLATLPLATSMSPAARLATLTPSAGMPFHARAHDAAASGRYTAARLPRRAWLSNR